MENHPGNRLYPGYLCQKLKASLGAVPNTAGSKAIGCILARTHTTDPFFSKITRGLEREALRSGYTVKYIFSYQDIENPDIQEAIQQTKVEGVALLGRPDSRMRSF